MGLAAVGVRADAAGADLLPQLEAARDCGDILNGPSFRSGANANQDAGMTVPIAVIPMGARVRVRQGPLPTDPALIGRTGTVVESSEYSAARYGVALDGEPQVRVFGLGELEIVQFDALPPEREEAKRRRALP